ncbi:MAG: hypothetical protein H6555_09090 [Lewinellaceae bacterium]|nr:hypothetical protein [Lewinellaceae bacterium]
MNTFSKTCSILCLALLFPVLTWSQTRVLPPGYVHAYSQGLAYTEAHFQQGLHFVEFLLNTRLSASERQAGLQEALQSFRHDPQGTLAELNQVDQQMQQVYMLTDVPTIGLVRSALLAQLYTAFQGTPNPPILVTLMEKYTPLLALDLQNNLALTRQDAEGFYDFLILVGKLNNPSLTVNPQEREQVVQWLGNSFATLSLEEKQWLCIMGVFNAYVQELVAELGPSQKQQLAQAAYPQATPSPPQGDGEYYKWISEMMAQNHLSMLNVLENMGDDGGYWERRKFDW